MMATFLAGIFMTTFAAAGIFFLKFWKASRDKFFLHFSTACWLIAVERIIIVIREDLYNIRAGGEAGSWVYLIRLIAFILIFAAVYQKNRRTSK